MVELRALGPLELWHDGQQYALGSVKERCVLAVLVHARGESVTADAIMDRVWDGSPPRTATDTLHTYLSRLRGHLGACGGEAGVDKLSPGLYRLRIEPESVDLLRFERLRRDAATAPRDPPDRAVGLLRSAEALWRGEPLAEFTGSWAASTRTRLVEDLRRVREERIRLELESGRHADLIGELRELVAQNPLAQKPVASLMLALYRCGRPDEALRLYRETHRRLDGEQGMEPGVELRELHRRILEQDRDLLVIEAPAARPAAAPARTNLPRDTPDFTGRGGELHILLTGQRATRRGTQALPLTVVHGMPGVGKTTLAVHVAHRLSRSYPDGQIFVDLRGYGGQPYAPAEALARLLHTCGVPEEELPDSLDERAARWREWTARRRLLLVLDNARDTAQVEPLLPGSAGCRAIVTSRNRLRLGGADFLHLDVLSQSEAAELFTQVVGAARLAGDDAALERVVAACGCHPLALHLLAGRFRHRDSWDLPHLLDRLSRSAGTLDEFDDRVASAFRLSYAELGDPARQTFRRLALHPGPDLTFPAAAALSGADPGPYAAELQRSMDELQDCNLLDEPVRDRFQLHDLARAFGVQAGAETDPPAVRRTALDRLLAYYLTTAHRATRLAHPHHRLLPLAREHVSPYALEPADADEALVWLSVERANLLAAAALAAAESPALAARFPHVLAPSLKRWGTREPAGGLYDAAVSALRDSGERPVLARTLVDRADLLAQENPGEALRCAQDALAAFREEGDVLGCADALLQTGRAHLAGGDGEMALRTLEEAQMHYRRSGDRHGEAQCLNVRGFALVHAGRYRDALDSVRATLALHRETGDLHGEAMALNNLGELQRHQGDYESARAYYEQCLALMQRYGGRQEMAILATNLGTVYQATGQTSRALSSFQWALHSHRAAGDPLGEVNVLISLGTAYASCGRRGEALLHFIRAEQVADGIGNAFERQRALIGMADVQRESGRLTAAGEAYERARAVAREAGIPLGAAHALAGLAQVALASGDTEQAERYAKEAINLFRSVEAHAEADRLERLLREQGQTGT